MEQKLGLQERKDKVTTRVKLPWTKVSPIKALLKYGWTDKDKQETAPDLEEKNRASSESNSEAEEIGTSVKSLKTATWIITKPLSKRQLGCLHVLGRCYRTPGFHYKNWMEVAEGVESTAFSSACKQCFPLGYPIIKDAHLETVEAAVDAGMLTEAPEEGESSSEA